MLVDCSGGEMAPRAGLEPATKRLTAACSTTELPRNTVSPAVYSKSYFNSPAFYLKIRKFITLNILDAPVSSIIQSFNQLGAFNQLGGKIDLSCVSALKKVIFNFNLSGSNPQIAFILCLATFGTV